MTRHERRKLARARKNAKAEILNSRALHVLHEEQRKRNLSRTKPSKRTLMRSSAGRFTEGYSAHGANGIKLYASTGKIVRNRSGGKKVKGDSQFDWSQVRDDYCLAGERISSGYARERYQGCVPNCERADFKGPYKLKQA